MTGCAAATAAPDGAEEEPVGLKRDPNLAATIHSTLAVDRALLRRGEIPPPR